MRMGPRQWIAWKLVQLAHRVYNPDRYERITITDPDGVDVMEWTVLGDCYGCGVSSQIGHDKFGGYATHWEDFEPDWLED